MRYLWSSPDCEVAWVLIKPFRIESVMSTEWTKPVLRWSDDFSSKADIGGSQTTEVGGQDLFYDLPKTDGGGSGCHAAQSCMQNHNDANRQTHDVSSWHDTPGATETRKILWEKCANSTAIPGHERSRTNILFKYLLTGMNRVQTYINIWKVI